MPVIEKPIPSAPLRLCASPSPSSNSMVTAEARISGSMNRVMRTPTPRSHRCGAPKDDSPRRQSWGPRLEGSPAPAGRQTVNIPVPELTAWLPPERGLHLIRFGAGDEVDLPLVATSWWGLAQQGVRYLLPRSGAGRVDYTGMLRGCGWVDGRQKGPRYGQIGGWMLMDVDGTPDAWSVLMVVHPRLHRFRSAGLGTLCGRTQQNISTSVQHD
jgi:hypothetical protein